ncbi:MAG: YciI family protein [Planctomycetota bacterium]|jgi:uncharacterized protein YciI
MRSGARLARVALCAFALGCSSTPEPVLPPVVDEPETEEVEEDRGAGMRTYFMALLYRGPEWTAEASPGTIELQERHLANIDRLVASGKMILAGPFFPPVGDDPLVGLFLFDVETLAEAGELVNSDPSVRAGRLRVEVLTWYGPVGITWRGGAPR